MTDWKVQTSLFRTGFTLCSAENKPNAGGGVGQAMVGGEEDFGVEVTDGGGSAGGGGGGWSSEEICNLSIGTVSAGGLGGCHRLGA